MFLAEHDRLKQILSAADPMTVLAVQDTTDLDLTGHRVSAKIGSMNYAKRKGYFAHNHLFLNDKGNAIGLFDQYLWNRNAEDFGKDRFVWPLKDKESSRWLDHFNKLQSFFVNFPQHTVVDICDREGDFYEMFQAKQVSNVHLLIRSRKDKELVGGEKLWSTLAVQTESDNFEAEIYDDKGKKHKLTFRVKYCPVTIKANYRARRDQPQQSNPVDLFGILVEQISPLQSWQQNKPITWRLLTTMEIQDFSKALLLVQFYIWRWRIEEYHYILKQGCKVQSTQLEKEQSVENLITFYSLLAWKVLNLRYGATENPDAPIEDFGFTQKEFFILATFLNNQGRAKVDPSQPCNGIADFTRYIKALATTSKSNRPPGVKSLWIGIEKLYLIIKAFEAFT